MRNILRSDSRLSFNLGNFQWLITTPLISYEEAYQCIFQTRKEKRLKKNIKRSIKNIIKYQQKGCQGKTTTIFGSELAFSINFLPYSKQSIDIY